MPTPNPTQSTTRKRPPRFNAHRLRETLTTQFAKCLCSIFLTLLLIVGVIMFVLWLSLRPHRPHFNLASLSAASIASPADLANSTISFNVTDRNSNKKIGIYYDAVFGSVLYKDHLIGSGPVMFPFYQPPNNTTVIIADLAGAPVAAGSALSTELSADAAAGRVELRLELNSTIRFKVKTWDTHQHHLHVECNVVVGSDGSLLPESRNIRCPIYF
ncbi:hypothetical protein Cni_G23896 [Canna indica]|uniref:Late embryogenesis abundant protein LEA-2 subgroup domain-containing protein n=1 Tax=Canna indica TaxID=4628 RepID=A0AAQ3KUZ2_9LILI|nr:hypothetical protein Cni_G23896 [Canna indica]